MPPAVGAVAAAERARTGLHDDDAAARRRPGTTIWRCNAGVEGRERDRAAARVASADTSSLTSMAPPHARAPRGKWGIGGEGLEWMADDCSAAKMSDDEN